MSASAGPAVLRPMRGDLLAAIAVDPRRDGDANSRSDVARRLAAPLAILFLAIALQAYFGAFGDISWMLTIGEKWLDGQTPYVDFVETNPPASILAYMPAIAAARALGAKPEFVVALYGFGSAAAALAVSAAILRGAGLLERLGPIALGLALVAVMILPGRTFDERDFFAVLFGLPYLAAAAARVAGAAIGARAQILAGLGAGAMIAIKPPYAMIVLVLAPYLLARVGLPRLLRSIEPYAAAACLLGYAALVAWRFPAYLSDVLPTVAAAYLPVRESLFGLVANVGVVLWIALGAMLFGVAGRRVSDPLIAVPALGSLGAAAAFAIQGKGWLYQFYPALALIALALAAALELKRRETHEIVAAILIASATLGCVVALGAPPVPSAIAFVLAAYSAVRGRGASPAASRLAILSSGGLIGAACGVYCSAVPGPAPEFTRALAALGPHPSMAAIAEGLGVGFPLVRNVGGVWVQRTQGLLMTAGARRLIDENPDDHALAARLEPIIRRDRDMVAEDIERHRPDALLVSRHGARFNAWATSDPVLAAARADYVLTMQNPGKDWPVDLYVRRDLVRSRPASSDIEPPPARAR
jgi:hypothetical protein